MTENSVPATSDVQFIKLLKPIYERLRRWPLVLAVYLELEHRARWSGPARVPTPDGRYLVELNVGQSVCGTGELAALLLGADRHRQQIRGALDRLEKFDLISTESLREGTTNYGTRITLLRYTKNGVFAASQQPTSQPTSEPTPQPTSNRPPTTNERDLDQDLARACSPDGSGSGSSGSGVVMAPVADGRIERKQASVSPWLDALGRDPSGSSYRSHWWRLLASYMDRTEEEIEWLFDYALRDPVPSASPWLLEGGASRRIEFELLRAAAVAWQSNLDVADILNVALKSWGKPIELDRALKVTKERVRQRIQGRRRRQHRQRCWEEAA